MRRNINEIKDGTWCDSLTAIVVVGVKLKVWIVCETHEQKLVKVGSSRLPSRSVSMVISFCFAPRMVV